MTPEEPVGLQRQLQAQGELLADSIEHQTAVSAILAAINRSPGDATGVFDAILASAVRLCRGLFADVFLAVDEQVHLAAHNFIGSDADRDRVDVALRAYPLPLVPQVLPARVILEGCVIQFTDVETDPNVTELTRRFGRAVGFRSGVFVPMVRDGRGVGAIGVARAEPGPFTERQIQLLRTFADQAAMAIGHTRLVSELRERSVQLTRSVNELTALNDVARALSASLEQDVVLRTIMSHVHSIGAIDASSIYEYHEARGEFVERATLHLGAITGGQATVVHKGHGSVGRLALNHEPVQIADIEHDATYQSRSRESLLKAGFRALLALPMLREGRLVGALVVGRKSAGPFEPAVVESLLTFAAHSALAIENSRLFRELREQSMQLEIANRHKSAFVANMSHELRTPLNAIIGFSEVLVEQMFGPVNDKQMEYLQDIHASGQHLLSLINDVLDLAKIEAGRMEIDRSCFDLGLLLDNALTLVRERAQRGGLRLSLQVGDGLSAWVADARKLKQVVINLLSNAVKFTPTGGSVSVAARLLPGAGPPVCEVSVADTGVGIAPEEQAQVFEEFRQAGSDPLRKAEGSGLGLALARRFVELHGGSIRVDSEPGRGSVFSFRLPQLELPE